jgi:hypothetical protein
MIKHDEADRESAPNQLVSEENLLSLRASNMSYVRTSRQRRIGPWCNEADGSNACHTRDTSSLV